MGDMEGLELEGRWVAARWLAVLVGLRGWEGALVGSAVWVVWEALEEASEEAWVVLARVWVARARLEEGLRRRDIRLVRRMSMVQMRGRLQIICVRLSSEVEVEVEVEGSGVV
jgi:hypothetical protein